MPFQAICIDRIIDSEQLYECFNCTALCNEMDDTIWLGYYTILLRQYSYPIQLLNSSKVQFVCKIDVVVLMSL